MASTIIVGSFVLIFISFSIEIVSPLSTTSLYSDDSAILELTPENFNSYVYSNNSKAFLVQFYLVYCGHCILYAPVWKKTNRELEAWDDVLQLAVINCASSKAATFCVSEHGVGRTPILKYFPFKSHSAYDGQRQSGDKNNIPLLTSYLASTVANDKTKSHSVPRFSPLGRNENIAHVRSPGAQYVTVIFERSGHDIANQVILDFSKQSSIDVLAASSDHPLLAGKTNVLPALLIFEESSLNWPKYISQQAIDRKFAVQMIRQMTKGTIAKKPQESLRAPRIIRPHPAPPVVAKRTDTFSSIKDTRVVPDLSKHKVHLTDLKTALSYLLFTEVGKYKQITGQKLRSLRDFISLLRNYFPDRAVRNLLGPISNWISTTDSIGGKSWKQYVNAMNAFYGYPLSKEERWITCNGSQPKFRGYSCGLWILLHSLTVHAYKEDGTNEKFNALHVLEPIHGYIRDFFGCTVCAKHFENGARKMPETVKKRRDSILWLWRSHNISNKYLAGNENSEDPLFPKTQFPPKELCPSCHTIDQQWDEEEVTNFLINLYTTIQK